MDFNEIVGHERVIETIKNAIKQKHIFHCYLFVGEESIGKRMVALSFAKTLLCKKQGLEPCNSCNSCLKFDNWNHPDLEFIQPEKGKIKKEVIDEMVKKTSIGPLESSRRTIIIDDCDKLGIDSQNALLKTLEEPPSYINIILITSNINNLLSTIISRCQMMKFYPVENEKIVEMLTKGYGKTQEEASFIAHFTKGSIGQSINLSKSEKFFQDREEAIGIIHSIITGEKINIFNSIEYFNSNKDSIEEILDIFLYWFRDLLIYKEIGDSKLIINKDKIQLLSKERFLGKEKINGIIDSIINTNNYINSNINYQLAIETMLLGIQEV